jgi:hypothetical protein
MAFDFSNEMRNWVSSSLPELAVVKNNLLGLARDGHGTTLALEFGVNPGSQ